VVSIPTGGYLQWVPSFGAQESIHINSSALKLG
jgi:hypothetical protein